MYVCYEVKVFISRSKYGYWLSQREFYLGSSFVNLTCYSS